MLARTPKDQIPIPAEDDKTSVLFIAHEFLEPGCRANGLVLDDLASLFISTTHAANTSERSRTPTIVLVHGAFADASSWNGVIPKLQAEGYQVIAVANPLRSLASDSAYVSSIVKTIEGPVVLVGHSYGGAVINNAAVGRDNVKALVLVAGFAPEAGESAADLVGKFPGATLGPALAAPVRLEGGRNDLYIKQSQFREPFAADLPASAVKLAASGWHTAALTMRLNVEGGLPIAGGIIGAGGEIAWPLPLRAGDTIHVESEIVASVEPSCASGFSALRHAST